MLWQSNQICREYISGFNPENYGGKGKAELDYGGGLDAQCTKLCCVPRGSGGMPPGNFFKKLGTLRSNLEAHFAKYIHTVTFIPHDYAIVPTTLYIKQVKS